LEATVRNEMKIKKRLKLAANIDGPGWNFLGRSAACSIVVEIIVRGTSISAYEAKGS
jgi:hypothetical protein